MKERTEQDMAELHKHSNHVAIMVAVASGYSDDVIDAARAAGAKGGTVIRGRRRNSERMGSAAHGIVIALPVEDAIGREG